MEVSPELDPGGYQILPLLLQPIVENAISHGIKECPHQGMIRIRVWVEEGKELRIQVSDNGVGISSEELEQLQAHICLLYTSPLPSCKVCPPRPEKREFAFFSGRGTTTFALFRAQYSL